MHLRSVVEAYFDAMSRGPEGGPELLALFAEEAVYIEPFSGEPRTHRGRAAIQAQLESGWKEAPPDLELKVHSVSVDGEVVEAHWSCMSPVFPAPVHGDDRYRIEAGRITRLETSLR